MSVHSRVVWSEGLFLQPHHFQQQDRYIERYVETRCQGLLAHSWGLTDLEIERDYLAIGKLGLRRATGVFPDGTPFRMPDDDPLPEPLDIGDGVRDQIVHLAVPLRRPNALEVDRGSGEELTRQRVRELEVRDGASASGAEAVIEVGALSTRILLASDVTQAWACIPVASIVECRSDRRVVLDDGFIPSVLQAGASVRLSTFMTELLGLLHQRGEQLAGRVTATSRGGAAEIAEFLMLQAVNRLEPLLAHCAESGRLHPEDLFRLGLSLAGEMATFTAPTKRPPALATYRHDRLRESFDPLIAALRSAFSYEHVQAAVPIPIEPRRFNVSVATVADRSLLTSAVFVLAARADMPAEELRRRFPAQIRIAAVEKIRDLVNLQLPGVPIHPIPVAPRQIPFHAGFVYFELDLSNELWTQVRSSGGIAMHVAGEFPNLALEFWAIRA